MLDETAENMHKNFGSGYPGGKSLDFLTFVLFLSWTLTFEMFFLDPETKSWLNDHKHSVFGFPSLVRFSWGTCTSYSKNIVDVVW